MPALGRAINHPWFDKFMWNFHHVEWQGFSTWDLVMPLFLFMSGVSIPFAMSRYKKQTDKSQVYYRIDHKQHRKGIKWLKYFGMNSIFAYMLVNIVSFNSITQSLLFGFEQYIGAWYPVLIATANSATMFFILKYMYKHKIFLKV